jgi:hypothetical protein
MSFPQMKFLRMLLTIPKWRIGGIIRCRTRAGRKAPINRTHSKHFALAAGSAVDASAFGVRALLAPLSPGTMRPKKETGTAGT